MRAGLLLALALPALASAAEFRSNAPLTLSSGDALHRVALPFEVYRDSRPDLADVRVVNAQGEAVPIAWAGEPELQKEAPRLVELPIFPVARRQPGTAMPFTDVTVRASDGMLVSIRSKGAVAKPAPAATMAYLLDASQVQDPIRALVVEWKAIAGTQIVPLRVEASDDLIAWSQAGSAPVLKVESPGREPLTQPRVAFTPRKAKYFRVTWSGPEFALENVRAEL